MSKAIFLCKRRLSYGNSYGLINSATFVSEYLKTIGVNSKVEIANDANDIDRLVTEFDPYFVFIEALWVTPEKIKEIASLNRHKTRLFVIRLHSRPTFIANEGIAFQWLLGYRELGLSNLLIAPNNLEFSDDLRYAFNSKSVYLPNIYYAPEYNDSSYNTYNKGVVKIGCFGSMRPMKNHLTQAIAAVKFANDKDSCLEFHINGTRTEQQGDQVLRNLRAFFEGQYNRHRLIEHDWLSHEDFVYLIRTLDAGMQVSLSETFNIVAADFVYNDRPFIGSKQISWLPSRFQVTNTNSTDEIVEKLHYAIGTVGRFMKRTAKNALIENTYEAQKMWRKFIYR